MGRRAGKESGLSGLRVPPNPPEGATAYALAMHYVSYFENDFARARTVVKRKSMITVVATSVLTGLIGVVGALVAVWEKPALGVVSTALAAAVGVVAAWDGLFRHRDLWVQRSLILAQIQAVKRRAEFRVAAGEDELAVARDAMSRMDTILSQDVESWSRLRERTQDGRPSQ